MLITLVNAGLFAISYEIIEPSAEGWGVQLGPRNWTGAVGLLLNREADLVPFIGITGHRTEDVSLMQSHSSLRDH